MSDLKKEKIQNYILDTFSELNYRIEPSSEADNDEGEYMFILMDNSVNPLREVGRVSMVVSTSDIIQNKGRSVTRHSRLNPVETDVININWLEVHDSYKGKKIGTLLLIYSMVYVMNEHPEIQYATLDDDTDRSNNIKNIYAGLLFAHNDHTEIIDTKHTLLKGPEKTAFIGDISYLDFLYKKILQTTSKGRSSKSKSNSKSRSKSKSKSKSKYKTKSRSKS